MGHDELNRVVVVHPDGAASDASLRVGDLVRSVDGTPLVGLLTAALHGKERVELQLLRNPDEPFAWADLRKAAADAQFSTLAVALQLVGTGS
jgi:C-terminal processing protease CtpA/Prc